MELIEFNTERLRLRQWRETDRELFARMNADFRVMEFFPSLLDRAASDAMVDRIRNSIDERGWGFWVAETLVEEQFIGLVGLSIPKYELPFSPCVEIGWRLAFDYWHKGYATEAAIGSLQIGFEQLQLNEIVSFTAAQNLRSQAVMQRLGMSRDKATFEHPAVPDDNPLKEHVLYRLNREQWHNQHLSPLKPHHE